MPSPVTSPTQFADPSANIGLSAVVGTALTALRSDGASALSQAITPTWTAPHTWALVNNGDQLTIKATDTVTGGRILLILDKETTGTPANEDGPAIRFTGQSSTTANTLMGTLSCVWADVVQASRLAKLKFFVTNLGLRTKATLWGSGGFSVGSTTGTGDDSTTDPGPGIINAGVGFRINQAAATGAVLIGDGTNFVADTTPTFADVVTLAAGSTSIAPLNIQTASALKTTPADGDIEMDANCLYGCTDVGNRGYIPVRQIIRADSTVTQANDANPHAIFTTPTNGRLTLEAGTYRVQGLLAWTSMSATSGNLQIDLLGAGTATVAAWLWLGLGQDQTSGQQGAQIGASWMVTNISNTNIATAAGNTAFVLKIDGTFEVSVAGTIIPTQTVKTAAAAVLSVGSFLEFWRIGNNTMTNVGQWD